VLTEDHVRLREPVEEAVVDHRLRARRGLLRGLEHRHQRPVPPLARGGELSCSPCEPGDVHVVTARVHDTLGLARVVEAGLLLHRQRVHVCAQHHRRTVAVSKQTDDTPLPHTDRHVQSGSLQPLRRQCGRTLLLHRQLRMSMYVLVERLQVVEHRLDAVEDRPCSSVGHCSSITDTARPERQAR
jgi:hypothetical protein